MMKKRGKKKGKYRDVDDESGTGSSTDQAGKSRCRKKRRDAEEEDTATEDGSDEETGDSPDDEDEKGRVKKGELELFLGIGEGDRRLLTKLLLLCA